MTDFWLDSPESLIDLNFKNLDGILNFLTILTVFITIIGVYNDYPNALNYGLLVLVLIISISKCAPEGWTDNIIFLKQSEQNKGLETKIDESLETIKSCRQPTQDNPMSNKLITDFGVQDQYSGVCTDDNSEKIQDAVLDSYIMDPSDYYWNRGRKHQWYSITENDQSSFADWVYNDKNNCKADSIFMHSPSNAKGTYCEPLLSDSQQYGSNNYALLNPDGSNL